MRTLPGADARLFSDGMGSDVGAMLFQHLYYPMVQRDALAHGDHIYGVIKSAQVNHGGRTSGYTANDRQPVFFAVGFKAWDVYAARSAGSHFNGTFACQGLEVLFRRVRRLEAQLLGDLGAGGLDPIGEIGRQGLQTLINGRRRSALHRAQATFKGDKTVAEAVQSLIGAGFGFFQAPNNRTLIGSAPSGRSGAAGGMLATARLLGQTTGAVLMGMGYGPLNPASSHLLNRVSPPRHLSKIFSLKQTGVPLGAVLAGALLPPLVLWGGWRVAVWVVAGTCAMLALALQPLRAAFDTDRQAGARVGLEGDRQRHRYPRKRSRTPVPAL